MSPGDRTIIQLPLQELFNEHGSVRAVRQRTLTADDVKELLGAGPLKFVVADVGAKPVWVSETDRYSFWKEEVRPHLVGSVDRVQSDSFPGGYCYIASEWSLSDDTPVVVLEVCH